MKIEYETALISVRVTPSTKKFWIKQAKKRGWKLSKKIKFILLEAETQILINK